MATTGQTESRQARAHALAKADADKHAAARDVVSGNRDQAHRELARLQAEKQELSEQRGTALLAAASDPSQRAKADALRTKIEHVDKQLRDAQDLHAAASQRAVELSQIHGEAAAVHGKAARDLIREPCETALERIDSLFADLAAAWQVAGEESRKLDLEHQDLYGQSQLRRLQQRIFLPHVAANGVYGLAIPNRSDLG